MKILIIIIALIVAALGIKLWSDMAGQLKKSDDDVRFESSDGVWTDGTVNFKGRDFAQVVWSFEAYKFLSGKNDITLVRTTTPKPGQLYGPEWKVPYAPSSGRADSIVLAHKPDQLAEIEIRAKAALAYWNSK